MTMKKHFLYLSTAALLAMSFASCVDNDEPKGLEYLRYARANKWDAEADQIRMQTMMKDSIWQSLLNEEQELKNIKKEALDKLEIEEKTYELTVTKCSLDVQAAQYKYDLALLDVTEPTKIENAKATLAAAQLALKKAQDELDKFELEANIKKAEWEKDIKQREANLKDNLLTIQKQLDNNKLNVDEWAAQLEANTYERSIKNLLIIAAAHKNAWEQNGYKVSEAYTLLKTKEGDMITAQKNLEAAKQAFLIAINAYEKDSLLNDLETRKKEVTAKQNAYAKGQKEVELKEQALAEFKEVSQGDVEDWNKAYNNLNTEIKTLEKQISYKEIDIEEATQAITKATKALQLKKDEIDKPLTDFRDKLVYYTFVMDDEIVYDADGNEKFTLSTAKFDTKKGVIANKDGVKNSDLHTNLDEFLMYIGGSLDRTKIGKTATYNGSDVKYMDETRIKAVEAEINGLVKANEGKEKTLTEFINKYNAQIAVKVSDSTTNEQKLKELKAQDEPKNKFNDDSLVFMAAVKAYTDSVTIYKWSDENGKSTVYERIESELIAYGKEYSKLYTKLATEDPAKITTDSDLNQKRTNIKNKLNEYWNIRKGFDGAYASLTTAFKDNVLNNTLAEDKRADFDAIVNGVDFNAATVDVSSLMKSNDRIKGTFVKDDKEYDAGVWSKYVTAAKNLLGVTVADGETDVQYRAYNTVQINQFKANSWKDANNNPVSGSMVDYYKWLEAQEKLQEKIDKAHDNQEVVVIKADGSIDYDAIYADGGTVQLKEAIAYKEQEIAKEIEENNVEIAKKQNNIDTNDLWKDLYEEIADVLDAYDAEEKALTIAQQEDYNTKLASLQQALIDAQDNKAKLEIEKGELDTEKSTKTNIKNKYNSLITAVAETATATDAELKAEIIIKYAIIDLERGIETAKETLAGKKIELENAQRDLEDFLAGEYSAADNDGLSILLTQTQNVREKEILYEQAVHEYEVAQTYFDEVLAAFEAE
jgi:hypothetical protein